MTIELTNVAKQLDAVVPRDRKFLFICVGTDRSTGDAFGGLVGMKLDEYFSQIGCDIPVLGTLHSPVHALNLKEKKLLIQIQYPNHYVIAIDASLGNQDYVGRILFHNEPLRAGAGVGRELPLIGNCHISGVVNVSSGSFSALQNTRLSLVMDMADVAYDEIRRFIDYRLENVLWKKPSEIAT